MTAKYKTMIKREERARMIASMGLVDRDRDRFLVSSPGLFAKENAYVVRRDDRGQIRCSCLEYEEAVVTDRDFRCEHIMAVKFAVAAKNTEPAARKPVNATGEAEVSGKTESTAVGIIKKPRRRTKTARAVSPAVRTMVSDGSAVGEQKTVARLADAALNGRSAAVEAAAWQLAIKKGANRMDSKASVNTVTEEPTTANVLNFRASTPERGEQLKFVWPTVGQHDQKGFRPFADTVTWQTVAGILDNHAPGWSHRVKETRCVGGIFIVTVAITIDGVTREGIGTTLADNERGIAKAEFDGFKRAAVKFDFARDLEEQVSGELSTRKPPGGMYANPVARTLGELVTARQLGMIRMLAREKGANAEKECQAMFGCRTDELSKRAASALIERLQEISVIQTLDGASAMRRAI